MIALDTNVLLRLLVADDAKQAEKVRALFDAHADEDGAFWIADSVIAELVWALDRSYGRSRVEVAAALRALAGSATVQFESPEAVVEAIALFEQGPADFVDGLLAIKARQAGCSALRSFDRRMRSLPGVLPL